MTRYAVELTDAALAAIAEHARGIAVEGQAPENAKCSLERMWDAVDSLEQSPRRAKAQEDDYVVYEVRQLVVGSDLLLFTVGDDKRTFWIVGLRHGRRHPISARLVVPTSLEASCTACGNL